MFILIKSLIIASVFCSSFSLATIANAAPASCTSHFVIGTDGQIHLICD